MQTGELNFPLVDYTQHPAFAQLPGRTESDAEINKGLLQIDGALCDCESSPACRGREKIEAYFARHIDPLFADLGQRTIQGLPGTEPGAAGVVQESLTLARKLLLDEVLLRDAGKGYRGRVPSESQAERVAREMADHGSAVCRLDEADVQELLDLTARERQKLAETAERSPNGRAVTGFFLRSGCGKKVCELVRRHGLLGGASHYLRQELETTYIALELSHDRQRWWRDCYDDVGLPTSPATYMHNDESLDVPKVIIYLAEVGEAQGPFSFVRGSHRWRRSATQAAVFKGFDATWATRLAADPESNAVYYRRRFKFPRHRAQFKALPREFQGCSHFGDDLVAGQPLTQWLLERETRYVGERGTAILFDGGLGIHRGGLVTEGQRWALNIGLRKRPSLLHRARRELWYSALPLLSAGKGALHRGVGLLTGGRNGAR